MWIETKFMSENIIKKLNLIEYILIVNFNKCALETLKFTDSQFQLKPFKTVSSEVEIQAFSPQTQNQEEFHINCHKTKCCKMIKLKIPNIELKTFLSTSDYKMKLCFDGHWQFSVMIVSLRVKLSIGFDRKLINCVKEKKLR